MSGLTRFGTFPAPYGAAVPVYRAPTPDPHDPEALVFDIQGAAVCAGISDTAERERSAALPNRREEVSYAQG